MVHPERNEGRFRVRTNQTLKLNKTIMKREKAPGYYNTDDEHVCFSLNKHKAWEMVNQVANSDNKSKHKEENTSKEKRQLFQHELNKSKHNKKLEKREVSKLKKQLESSLSNKRDQCELDHTIQRRYMDPNEYMAYRSIRQVVPKNGILISEPMPRRKLYKILQRDPIAPRTSQQKEESRRKKLEDISQTINNSL